MNPTTYRFYFFLGKLSKNTIVLKTLENHPKTLLS
jgi:hypothetical protein